MKDFAQKSSQKKGKNCNFVFGFLGLLVKVLLIFFSVLMVSLFFIWFVVWQSPLSKEDINFLFIFNDNNCEEEVFIFASYKSDRQLIQPYYFTKNYLFSYPDIEQGVMTKFSLTTENAKKILHADQFSSLSPFVVGQLFHHQIIINSFQDCSKLEEVANDSLLLKKTVNHQLIKMMQENPRTIHANTKWLNLFKRVNWDPIKEISESLPTSNAYASNCSIALINSTKISGYAQVVAQVLESSGLRVVRIDSDQQSVINNHLYLGEKENCQEIGKIIFSQLFQTNSSENFDTTGEMNSQYRADIVIQLGDESLEE